MYKSRSLGRLENLSNIKPLIRIHGGKNALKLSNKNKIIDFSVSVNPHGLPQTIKLSLDAESVSEYPDSESSELKDVLAKINKVGEENIFIGNGSAEIIGLLSFIFLKKGDNVVSLWPSFGDYRHYTIINRSKFIPIKLNPPHFKLKLDQVKKIIDIYSPMLIFFCNPNNPTGNYYSEQEVIALLEHTTSGFFVLDEAYVNLVLSRWNSVVLLKKFKKLIIIRSLTKDYALAGLRLGYSIASKEITDLLKSTAPSWNINLLAQENGVNIFKDKTFLKKSVPLIHQEKDRVISLLKGVGYDIVPSATNFYLVKVKNAKMATKLLLSKNIYVRDCTTLGLPQYLRISVRLAKDNDYLIRILSNLFKRITQ